PMWFPPVQDATPGKEYSTAISLRNNSDAPIKVDPPVVVDASDMTVRFDQTSPISLPPNDSVKIVAHVIPIRAVLLSTKVELDNSAKIDPNMKVQLTVNAVEKK